MTRRPRGHCPPLTTTLITSPVDPLSSNPSECGDPAKPGSSSEVADIVTQATLPSPDAL